MSDPQSRSFWLSRREDVPSEPLDGSTKADVVIVGGGFTGLWSSIRLKDADPALDVVVVEREVSGYGASGRNGGFAMTMVGRNLHDLLRKVGPARARATHLAMVETLREIEDFCAKEGIDADVTSPGLLTISNGPEQDVRIRQDLDAAERLGLDDFHPADAAACRELVAIERARCGHWEDTSLLVDPAALARGLREAAVRRGVRVYEQTPALHIDGAGRAVTVATPRGVVTADRGLIATNAYAHSIPEIRRYIFTIYAYITLTEPLSDEQWGRIGWERRMGIEDKRIMPHFHRPTPDGRILWGGRDAPFSGKGPDPRFDRDPRIAARLEETFRWTFPQLDDVKIDRHWAGPVCGSVNCMATIRWMSGHRLLYAVGYAGHGVGPSLLAATIVRDLLLGRTGAYTDLPMITKRPVPLPPEPIRSMVLKRSQRVLQRADDEGSDASPAVKAALKFLQ